MLQPSLREIVGHVAIDVVLPAARPLHTFSDASSFIANSTTTRSASCKWMQLQDPGERLLLGAGITHKPPDSCSPPEQADQPGAQCGPGRAQSPRCPMRPCLCCASRAACRTAWLGAGAFGLAGHAPALVPAARRLHRSQIWGHTVSPVWKGAVDVAEQL